MAQRHFTAPVTKCVLLWTDRPSDRPHSKLYPLMARAMIGPCPPRAASRRPGTTEETDARFIVRDANGQALACAYFEGKQRPCSRQITS